MSPAPAADDCYYGLYRAICVDDVDPEGRKRIRLQVPQLFGDATLPWALPCVPSSSTTPPAPDAGVWVTFEGGDPRYPVWLGVWITG